MLPEHLMLDYATLRIIWWLLLGVLLIGFAIMDGFDMGVACLMPVIARSNNQKRILLNSIGPVWEGNQVWLILGAGAVFAAWPIVYAAAFSGFYIAMFLLLIALILRPVGFDYRNKVDNPIWRAIWDMALFLGGFVPALMFGVVFGNLLQGTPFLFDHTLRFSYQGGLIGLLNPFALFCGLVSVIMLVIHGASFIILKTEGVLLLRAKRVITTLAPALIILFLIGGLWIAFGIDGYQITSDIGKRAVSDPLGKEVIATTGLWLANYSTYPVTICIPLLAVFALSMTLFFTKKNRAGWTFITSALSVACIVATAGISLFPFLMPSSLDPSMSLTVWDASSSRNTLQIMLIATIIFMPLVLLYTSWVFNVLRGKVTETMIKEKSGELY